MVCGRICPSNFAHPRWVIDICSAPSSPPRLPSKCRPKKPSSRRRPCSAGPPQPQNRHRRSVRPPSLPGASFTASPGLPNVGKSSFFNVLSETNLANAANFPYATINPEEARIPVPDPPLRLALHRLQARLPHPRLPHLHRHRRPHRRRLHRRRPRQRLPLPCPLRRRHLPGRPRI